LGAPAIADLDGDGVPEIVIGRQVLDDTGAILWTGTGGRGGDSVGPLSHVADIDDDGSPEVVAGNTVYSAAGAIEWQNRTFPTDGPQWPTSMPMGAPRWCSCSPGSCTSSTTTAR